MQKENSPSTVWRAQPAGRGKQLETTISFVKLKPWKAWRTACTPRWSQKIYWQRSTPVSSTTTMKTHQGKHTQLEMNATKILISTRLLGWRLLQPKHQRTQIMQTSSRLLQTNKHKNVYKMVCNPELKFIVYRRQNNLFPCLSLFWRTFF